MIIVRYLTKEMVITFLTVIGILLFIVLSNRFVIFLSKAITGELPLGLVCKMVVLYIPELLGFVLPLGVLFAILFAYGRLYADHEMVVLSSFGVSPHRLLRMTFISVSLVTVIALLLSLFIIPWSVKQRDQLMLEGEARGVMHSLVPGRFHVMDHGRRVFYIDKASNNKRRLEGIFIAEQPLNEQAVQEPWTVVLAERASLERDKTSGAFYLTLHDGHRYRGVPGALDYLVAQFKEYGRIIEYLIPILPSSIKTKSTQELWHSTHKEDMVEYQWRLAIPISVPILALFAFSFSRTAPRQGRFAKFFLGIFVYLLYYNLLILCKRWLLNGWIPDHLGFWVLHIVMGYFAYYFFNKNFRNTGL